MKNPFRILAIVMMAITLCTQTSFAKKEIRLKLQQGSVYETTVSMTMNMDQEMMGQKMKMEQTMDMILNYKVLEVLENKNYMIEYSVAQIKMDINANGQQMNMDTQGECNPPFDKLKSMIGQAIKFEITPLGKVERTEGMAEMLKKIGDDKNMEQMLPMLTTDDGLKSFMSQNFGYLPEGKVGTGDKWTNTAKMGAPVNMEVKMDYELLSESGNDVNLKVNSNINGDTKIEQMGMSMNMNIDGTQDGTMTIDTKDGWLRSSELTQDLKMIMKMKNPQNGEDMELPIALKSVVSIKAQKK